MILAQNSITLAQVNDGAKGEQGIGVTALTTQFYASVSPEILADGEWSYEQPAYQEGKYLWMREEVTWSNETISYTEPYYAGALDSANKAAQDALKEISETKIENSTLLQQTEANILAEVSSTYYTQKQAEALVEQYRLEIEHSAEALDLTFLELQKKVENQTETLSEREKFIRMVDGEIHIGEVGDPMIAVHTKESLEFRYNGVVIAKFTKKSLEVDTAHVKIQLAIHDNWAFRRGAQIKKAGKIIGNNLNIVWK